MLPHTLLPFLPSLSQHLLIAVLAVLVYVVTTRARQDQRAPSSAIAWVMGLALLPYLVLPMYLAFGRRKLRPAHSTRLPRGEAYSHWAAELAESFGLAPPGITRTRLHADGAAARDALWATIAAATERLDVCTFIIGQDALGRAVMQRLVGQARSGVRVRLLLDGFGALLLPRRYFDELRAAGGEVAVFRPLLGLRRAGPRNLRNHRKFVIADDRLLWSGGRNLAAEYFTGDTSAGIPPWADLSFELEGPTAAAAARQFEQDWASVQLKRPRHIPPGVAPAPSQGTITQFLPSGPDQTEDTAQAVLVAACFRARRRILAVTPYFVPNDALRDALRLAARRGVQVDIAIPAHSNHRLADMARSRAMRDLASAGARFHLLPAMAHAKAVVVDDTLAMCGSINLDLRSLLLNHEANVLFYDTADIAWLAGWIEALAADATAFDATPPHFFRDIGEGLLLTVAFQL
ncbi:phospholipase D-like domain-containing protein [Xylophilus sp. GOD-11R]|uniref:phospholipase D-like domain-containing protein n=1 Tax=Xylophilus sp. GOD-11R TaxID=3089814 RepID=UPI00298BD9ED|nr:phospholipase D-like domain-containing protein [Xylophilus sp. GOD-11R]WPB57875.1 phospholipase D-like domain-containing protein [Xylophilus sp. GOD-11R]